MGGGRPIASIVLSAAIWASTIVTASTTSTADARKLDSSVASATEFIGPDGFHGARPAGRSSPKDRDHRAVAGRDEPVGDAGT